VWQRPRVVESPDTCSPPSRSPRSGASSASARTASRSGSCPRPPVRAVPDQPELRRRIKTAFDPLRDRDPVPAADRLAPRHPGRRGPRPRERARPLDDLPPRHPRDNVPRSAGELARLSVLLDPRRRRGAGDRASRRNGRRAREHPRRAFMRTVAPGFRYLEIDLRAIADGRLVVWHGRGVERVRRSLVRAHDAAARICVGSFSRARTHAAAVSWERVLGETACTAAATRDVALALLPIPARDRRSCRRGSLRPRFARRVA
jgi:hypothetical protein